MIHDITPPVTNGRLWKKAHSFEFFIKCKKTLTWTETQLKATELLQLVLKTAHELSHPPLQPPSVFSLCHGGDDDDGDIDDDGEKLFPVTTIERHKVVDDGQLLYFTKWHGGLKTWEPPSVESMTPEQDWALGEQFTAADVVFGAWLDFSIRANWMKASSKVAAYVERIGARPLYKATHDWPAGLR